MRLIDADAIKLNKELPYKASVKRVLAQAPTVDAIPIEWLETWSRLYLAPTKEYTDIIEDIIKDYREEQGDETD